jgi:hypothetical protein
MFGSAILEVAIGLILIYALLSALCSAVNELVAGAFSLRARNLKHGVRTLLDDVGGTGLTKDLFDHGLVRALGSSPSYIPADVFAKALLGTVVARGKGGFPRTVGDLRAAIGKLPSGRLQEALLALIQDVEGEVVQAEHRLACWFDAAMERASGWYRRRVQLILLVLSLGVSLGLHVDTLEIGNALLRDSALRGAVVASAEAAVARSAIDTSVTPGAASREIYRQIQSLDLPLGWRHRRQGAGSSTADMIDHFAGLLLTTFALSLGASFWFDLLKRVVNLRSGGVPPARPATASPPPG